MDAAPLNGNEQPAPSLQDHITKLTMDLKAQVTTVRDLRAALESRTWEHHELQVAFNLQHKDLIESLCKARTDLVEEEAQLRNLTLQAYHESGSKKPAQGVGIRITRSLSYDEAAAKAWALKENPGFLVLDRPGFEAYAKVLLKMKRSIPGILLQEEEKPQATIAKEL